jgi:TPR repeat protein
MKKILLIVCLLISSAFADHFRDAMLAYKAGNYTQAKELFELSIKKENAVQGYFYLGKMYLYGEGTEANTSLAIPYLEQAVMKGNIKAKCYLAEAYLKNKIKHDDAILLLNQGAKESMTCKDIASAYNIQLNS